MKVLISDSNVLIDMEVGGLIELMFMLPFEFQIPDIMFEEELAEDHAHFLELGLIKAPLSGAMLLRAEALIEKYPAPSRNDIFGLVLAESCAVPLLTGDKKLRYATRQMGVELRGTIWLFGELLEHDLVTKASLSLAIKRMKEGRRRLPWPEAVELLRARR